MFGHARVNIRNKRVGRRFTAGYNGSSYLRLPYPAVVRIELKAGGGGAGSWHGFYLWFGEGGYGGGRATALVFAMPNTVLSVASAANYGSDPVGNGSGNDGVDGENTTYGSVTAIGGAKGLQGFLEVSTLPKSTELHYHTDVGLRAWPYGSNSPGLAVEGGANEVSRGGWGVEPTHDTYYKDVNCRGGSGRADMTIGG